jgi:excisionase family DNA binding protein
VTERAALTAAEVAEMLGVTPAFVLALGRSGALPRMALGRRTIRFSVVDVDRFVQSQHGSEAQGEGQRRRKRLPKRERPASSEPLVRRGDGGLDASGDAHPPLTLVRDQARRRARVLQDG